MKVLVVDDRPDNLYLLEQVLKSRGYEVKQAANGRDALRCAREEKFDLVISDIMMPEMDGFEFCRLLKSDDVLKDIPLVFYTATYTDAKDEALALSLGASAFITKPAEPAAFLKRVADVLEETSAGAVPPRQTALEEGSFLKVYNERLVRKLEDKVLELERKNAELANLSRTLEERVKAAVQDLEARNHELESFASSVSHDLRSPLRSIGGLATMLQDEIGSTLSEEHRARLQRIIKNAGQMSTLIDELLEYSRIGGSAITLAPTPLNPVLDEARELLAERLRETGASIEAEPLPAVMAKRQSLLQVFLNLFSNAVKFVPPGVAPVIKVSAQDLPGQVEIRVQDNGIGIEPRYQDQIFKIFERLHSSSAYGGHGIGLAIVKKAVEKMGGGVRVHSAPGEGSTFTLTLPKP